MKQAKVLNEKELKILLRVASTTKHGERNKLVVLFSYLAGLRACEIAALRICDVVDTHGQAKSEAYLSATQTKGNKAQCVVLNKSLQPCVEQYVSKDRNVAKRNEPLFVSQKRNAFTSQSIQNLFRNLYEAAGIEHASSHSGRRTFITKLSENGVSTRVIQELARHSSMATTQRYIDVSVEKLHAAAKLVSIK